MTDAALAAVLASATTVAVTYLKSRTDRAQRPSRSDHDGPCTPRRDDDGE